MPKLMFLSESCLLDRSSGAAISARAMLLALASAGWDVQAATLNCCDGDAEYPLASFHPDLDPAKGYGKSVLLEDGPIRHDIMVGHSTRHSQLRPWELRNYLEMAKARLENFQPDIVLTFSSKLLHPILGYAQRQGARTAFYLANPAVLHQPGISFSFIDEIIVPSHFVAEQCQNALNRSARVIGTIAPRLVDGRINSLPDRIAQRMNRFVTMINPAPQKGGLFFINLAAQAAVMAPDIKFRAVESRWRREKWEALGVPAVDLDRIEWHPHTHDMASVYSDAALLLVPSLWEEASGRVIVEAMLAGVPVLAMRNGGIVEQVGEGGILFDLPEALAANHLATPDTSDLVRWSQFIKVLMENDALYARVVSQALQEVENRAPEQRAAEAVAVFSSILQEPFRAAGNDNAAVANALQEYREKMTAEREDINARIEAGGGTNALLAEDTLYLPLLQRSLAQPAMQEALLASNAKDWAKARSILEPYLRIVPEDLAALALLAEVDVAQEREGEALEHLQRLVELAPGFLQGQQRLVTHLRRVGNANAALKYSAELLARIPENSRYQALHAGLLTAANRFDEAIALYENCFATYPGSAHDWMQYARALRTLGRQSEGIEAYRKAIQLAPTSGSAWHELSNMKLDVFEPADINYMEYLLSEEGISDEDRLNLHFTLGKAYEDAKRYDASFEHYAQGNVIRRALNDYDVGRIEDFVSQAKETFTAEFFDARANFGHQSADPIFVLGMHRAGSTLIEQILASHSQIEGTRELPNMLLIGREFGGLGVRNQEGRLIADLLRDLNSLESVDLGETYLKLCAPERHTGRPLFIDKMPANWIYTGLIHLVLPKAKIIDIRRKPMAAGFALFKMNFGQGVDHSYEQSDIARYYRAYTDLMAHFDEVLPNRVHRIQYEELVEDTETVIRRLIDYCDLPFEGQCLNYWKTERAIQTPSSEQVRQPIFKAAVDQWMHYAEWLEPMKEAFGDLIVPRDTPSEKIMGGTGSVR